MFHMPGTTKFNRIFSLAALIMLPVVFFIYYPGRNGGLLLDDLHNLHMLSEISSLFNVDEVMQFLLVHGKNHQLGRPISLLSFAFQYSSWHENLAALKLINIAIHLMNGVLVWLVARQVGRILGFDERLILACSFFSMAMWLLHPINVSTVLYLIQRMAQLSTLFILMSIWVYLRFRQNDLALAGTKEYLWLTFRIFLIGVLAVLSKENGVLIPVMLLLAEWVLFFNKPRPRILRVWIAICLILPSLLLVLFLIRAGFGVNADIRDFTIYERLLTEPRVLLIYLEKILLPHPSSFGLFYDDVSLSREFFSPPTTFFAILTVSFLLLAVWGARRRYPGISFGIGWFFAGHLLESTTLMLEIGFEHRNYLPLVGLLIGLNYELARFFSRFFSYKFSIFVAGTWLILLSLLTWAEVGLWSNNLRLATVWAKEKPDSERAQDMLGSELAQAGFMRESYTQFASSAAHFKNSASGYSALMLLSCIDENLPPRDTVNAIGRFEVARFSFAPIANLGKMLEIKEDGRCANISTADMHKMLNALLKNTSFRAIEQRSYLYTLQARVYAIEMNFGSALASLDESMIIYPRLDVAVHKISWLMALGRWSEAYLTLNEAKKIALLHPFDARIFRNVLIQMDETINQRLGRKSIGSSK